MSRANEMPIPNPWGSGYSGACPTPGCLGQISGIKRGGEDWEHTPCPKCGEGKDFRYVRSDA